jgi:hypothetical protein
VLIAPARRKHQPMRSASSTMILSDPRT